MKLQNRILKLSGILVLLSLWQLVSWLKLWEASLLPPPKAVGKAFYELVSDGILFKHIGISLFRFFSGYLLAISVALPLGLALGWFGNLRKAINPLIQIFRPISPIAWFPFIVLWFGIGNAPAIAIIAIAVFFPVLLSGITAIGKIDGIYLKLAANFGLSRWQFFYKMAFPLAFPYLIIGLRMALGSGWIFLVAGEMIGAQSGLGYLIVDSRNNLRLDMVLAGVLTIGVIGWLLDNSVHLLEKRVNLRWGITENTNNH